MLLASKIKLQVCNLNCMDILQDPLEMKGLAQTHEGFLVLWRRSSKHLSNSHVQLLKLTLCSGYKWLCLEQDLKDQKETSDISHYIFSPEN